MSKNRITDINKRRVVLIRNAQPYDFGGGERFPVFLAEILRDNGDLPLIISRSPKLLDFATTRDIATVKGWWWQNQNWSGPRVTLFPIYLLWQVILLCWYVIAFSRLKPNALHIQGKDDFVAATIAGRLYGCQVVWTDHADLKHIWRNMTIWYKNPVGHLVHLSARLAHSITVVSKSEQALISNNLSPNDPLRSKLNVVYNGVVDIKDSLRRDTIEDKPFTFCVASRLVTDKGIGEVIESFTRLHATHPHTQLILLGDGPEGDLFKEQAKDIPSVVFMGYQKEPLRYIADADVFVHPTYHEGFSVALVEASMLAKPIIATSVGGNVEIIRDGETGLLIKEKSVDSLHDAMDRLLIDDNLRTKLGESARQQYLDRFNFKSIVTDEFMPLYEKEVV